MSDMNAPLLDVAECVLLFLDRFSVNSPATKSFISPVYPVCQVITFAASIEKCEASVPWPPVYPVLHILELTYQRAVPTRQAYTSYISVWGMKADTDMLRDPSTI